jgi:hypothetical protein
MGNAGWPGGPDSGTTKRVPHIGPALADGGKLGCPTCLQLGMWGVAQRATRSCRRTQLSWVPHIDRLWQMGERLGAPLACSWAWGESRNARPLLQKGPTQRVPHICPVLADVETLGAPLACNWACGESRNARPLLQKGPTQRVPHIRSVVADGGNAGCPTCLQLGMGGVAQRATAPAEGHNTTGAPYPPDCGNRRKRWVPHLPAVGHVGTRATRDRSCRGHNRTGGGRPRSGPTQGVPHICPVLADVGARNPNRPLLYQGMAFSHAEKAAPQALPCCRKAVVGASRRVSRTRRGIDLRSATASATRSSEIP